MRHKPMLLSLDAANHGPYEVQFTNRKENVTGPGLMGTIWELWIMPYGEQPPTTVPDPEDPRYLKLITSETVAGVAEVPENYVIWVISTYCFLFPHATWRVTTNTQKLEASDLYTLNLFLGTVPYTPKYQVQIVETYWNPYDEYSVGGG